MKITEQVIRDNPGEAQHPLRTSLTHCRECGHSSHCGYVRTKWLTAMTLVPHTPTAPTTKCPEGHGCKPSPGPQSTYRLDV